VKATEVTAGLAESNGSLRPGLWHDSLHVTCGLTACTPGSAPGPTLGDEYGKTLPLPRRLTAGTRRNGLRVSVGQGVRRVTSSTTDWTVRHTHTQHPARIGRLGGLLSQSAVCNEFTIARERFNAHAAGEETRQRAPVSPMIGNDW